MKALASPRRWIACTAWLSLLAALLVSGRARAVDEPVLVVGLTGKYPPFNHFDDQGELVGFDVDFANALCSR